MKKMGKGKNLHKEKFSRIGGAGGWESCYILKSNTDLYFPYLDSKYKYPKPFLAQNFNSYLCYQNSREDLQIPSQNWTFAFVFQ